MIDGRRVGQDQNGAGYRLPAAQPWLHGESILGLIVRNAEPHGFADPRRLLKPLNLQGHKLSTLGIRFFDDSTARGLADLLAMDRRTFDRMHHGSSVPQTQTLFGHVLHHSLVSVETRRVCPLCLRDSPHHRAIWDLSVLTVCPEHGCFLLSRCPTPGCRPLTWNTSFVTTCSRNGCRRSLLDAPVHMAPPEQVDGIRRLVDLIKGECAYNPPFDQPGAAVRLSFDLGMIARGVRGFGKPVALAHNRPEFVLDVMNAGWSALANWPAGFRLFVDDLRSEAKQRHGRSGLAKEFGSLPDWLLLMAGHPDVAVLTDEFWNYVAKQDDVRTRASEIRRRRSEAPLSGKFIQGLEGAALLGVEYRRLRRVADAFDLWLVPPDGSGAPSLLRADKFRAIAEEVATHLTKTGVCHLLGVDKKVFWTIEDAALLPIIPEQQRILPERLYRRHDVEALLARLDAKAETTGPLAPRQDFVPMFTLSRGTINIGRILVEILSGRLVPDGINPDATGLRRLLFRRQWLHATLCRSERSMSTADVAAALGVDMNFAYDWVSRGLLRSTVSTSEAEPGRRISQEALDEFQKQFATGAELAASVGSRSRRYSSPHLMALGLVPVSGPTVDGARMYLFRRSDFAKLDTRPLEDFVAGRRPLTADTQAVNELIADVGKAAAKILKRPLTRRNNHFTDVSGSIVVQVVTGRRFGFAGAFRFTLTPCQITRLVAANDGYLAMGFVGQPRFLLVPWQAARSVLRQRSDFKADVCLSMDAAGQPSALREFCHLVRSMGTNRKRKQSAPTTRSEIRT